MNEGNVRPGHEKLVLSRNGGYWDLSNLVKSSWTFDLNCGLFDPIGDCYLDLMQTKIFLESRYQARLQVTRLVLT